MIATLIITALLLAQQTLPSAPQPKPTPNPLRIPANAPPPHAIPTPEPDDAKAKADQTDDLTPVDPQLLSGPDKLAAKEFFRQRLRPTIQRHWDRLVPQVAKGKRTWYGTVKEGKRGTTYVTFTMHKGGSITDITLDTSSGDEQMDRAVLQAIQESQPLPLWSTFKGDELKIRGAFMYNPKHAPLSAR